MWFLSSGLAHDHQKGTIFKAYAMPFGLRLLRLVSHQDLLHLEERLGTVNRGASQGTIERCTYPHKYKKVSRSAWSVTRTLEMSRLYVVVHV